MAVLRPELAGASQPRRGEFASFPVHLPTELSDSQRVQEQQNLRSTTWWYLFSKHT